MAQPQANVTESLNEWNIVGLKVDDLLLDPENPRLASTAGSASPTQADLMKTLWTEMSVDELVMSIAANGYFPEEPLFVVPVTLKGKKFYVVEGNRRLAATRILCDDKLRARLRVTNMPEIDEAAKQALRTLPASIYPSREKLWTYLSFRHINTPMEWDAYSKAKYVALVHEEYGVDLEEIARRIGDKHRTVLRMYRGYKVLRQAETEGVYDLSERYRTQFYFSHWYTALAYTQFQEFLGMRPEDFEKEQPVPKTHQEELGELLTWMYGRKRSDGTDIPPEVQKQNPHLKMLRDVISNPRSLDVLRSGYPLGRSYEVSLGNERRFRESLIRAKEELQQARGTVTIGYKGEDHLFQTIKEIRRVVNSLYTEMREIRDDAD